MNRLIGSFEQTSMHLHGEGTSNVYIPDINLVANPGKTIKIVFAITTLKGDAWYVDRATHLVSSIATDEQTSQRIAAQEYRAFGDKPYHILVYKFAPTASSLTIHMSPKSYEENIIDAISVEIYKSTA